jgi:hypothetical protein
MSSIIRADTIQDLSGNNIINESGNTITIGASGDTTNIVGTLQNNGSAVGGANTPNFFVVKSDGNQSLSHNTDTLITFNSELIDSNSAYASNKFTVPSGEGGTYFIGSQLSYIDPSVDDKALHTKIYKNGSEFTESKKRSSENDETVNVFALLSLSAGDYIEIYGRQGTGSSKNVQSGNNYTFFFGYKLI